MTGGPEAGEPATRPGEEGQQFIIAHKHGTVYGVMGGNQYIYLGAAPAFSIEPFPVVPPAAPSPQRRRRPSWLLAARNQVVGFTGRDEELADLTAWRDNPELGLGVRLLHGPGGQGKTRLAAELGHLSATAGWVVGLTRHQSDPVRPIGHIDAQQLTGMPGLLLVVDYAERWPRGDLLTLFQDPLLHHGVPTRALLLARSAGQWWASVQHPLGKLDVVTDQLHLQALADNPEHRRDVFNAARDRFAEVFAVGNPAGIGPPGPLTAVEYRLMLTVHIAALAAVEAHMRGDTPPGDPAALSAYLLDRERDHWQFMYDNDRRVRTHPDQMARAVVVATLAGPFAYLDGTTILERVGVGPAGQVLPDHAICYPPVDPATVLEPLYPDRLGEDFLALQTPGHDADYHADPWTATIPDRLLGVSTKGPDTNEPPPVYTARTIAVLAEAGRRWPHLADYLHGILHAQPTLAIAAGGATLTTIAAIAPVELLEAIEPHLPLQRHVDFDSAIAIITQRLTTHRLDSASDPATRAYLLGTLGLRLGNSGLHQQALVATEEAVEVSRRLAADNPGAFEPNLASALGNLGFHLAELGRREPALAAGEEAVEMLRRLAAANPAAFEPNLAMALNNLSVDLLNLGRREPALAASEEAVEVYRRLAATNPAAFEPDLASMLNNLGARLSELGRREPALAASEEAVEVYRRLAATNPAAFEPDLASMLNNLGARLSELGRREPALTATEEAVEVYRRLAATNPAAFEPDLARGLNNLSVDLLNLGRREPALAASEEAVEVYRRLVADNPAAFELEFARTLNNLSVNLLNLGRREPALAASEEAVEVYRRLPATNRAAFEPDLARGLRGPRGTSLSLLRGGDRFAMWRAIRHSTGSWRRCSTGSCRTWESGSGAWCAGRSPVRSAMVG